MEGAEVIRPLFTMNVIRAHTQRYYVFGWYPIPVCPPTPEIEPVSGVLCSRQTRTSGWRTESSRASMFFLGSSVYIQNKRSVNGFGLVSTKHHAWGWFRERD